MGKNQKIRSNPPGLLSSPEGYGDERMRVTAEIEGTERYVYRDFIADERSSVLTKARDKVVTIWKQDGINKKGHLHWEKRKETIKGRSIPRMPIGQYAEVVGVPVDEGASDSEILAHLRSMSPEASDGQAPIDLSASHPLREAA